MAVTQLHPHALPGIPRTFIAKAAGAAYVSYGKLFLYTAANWSGGSFYLESTMLVVSGEAKCRLYDTTTSTAVTDSEVSTTSATAARVRSSALTLTDGDVYTIQLLGSPAGDSRILGADLLYI